MILFSPNHHLIPTAVHGDGLWVFMMWAGETGGPSASARYSITIIFCPSPQNQELFSVFGAAMGLQSSFSTAAAVASSSAKKMHSPILPGSASSTASSVAAVVVVGGGGCLDPAQSSSVPPFWRRRRRRWRSSSPSAAAAVVVVPSSPSSCDHRRSYPPSSSARWWHVVGVGGGASVPLFGVDTLPAARGFGSGPAAGRGTSPRVVLGVSATASMDEIKASFRKVRDSSIVTPP
jgi:hypothetical protein